MHQRPPKKFVPVPFEYHQDIELDIDSLTNLGAGVGRIGGWVVFVPFALPGEKVRARVHRNDKNCSHADLVEVLVPSPDRVDSASVSSIGRSSPGRSLLLRRTMSAPPAS